MNNIFKIKNTTIKIIHDDILTIDVTAIVNPANRHLQHGGGLAGKIVKVGGDIIQTESNTLAPIKTGESVITSAGHLPCKFIIHTVGPMQGEGDEDNKIYRAFTSILDLATKLNFQSIAVPAISTGVFRYPTEKAAFFMHKAFYNFLQQNETSLETIYIVLYEKTKYHIFLKEFNQ